MMIKIAATFSSAFAPNESMHLSRASEDNQTVNTREHLEVWIAGAMGADLLTHE